MAVTNTEEQRNLTGVICPVCRFVFSLPKDFAGNGMICPACEQLLSVPVSGANAKLVRQVKVGQRDTSHNSQIPEQAGNQFFAKIEPEKAIGNVKRVKKTHRGALPGWDEGVSTSRSRPNKKRGLKMSAKVIAIGAISLLVLLLVARILLVRMGESEQPANIAATRLAPLEKAQINVGAEEELTENEKKQQIEARKLVKQSQKTVNEAKIIVRRFLTADSLEDAIKYVKSPEIAAPRMRAWYAQNGWVPMEAEKLNIGGEIRIKDNLALLTVQMEDFSRRQIAVEKAGDGYKVNWESWAVWSTIPWEEVFEKKPIKPIEIRVLASIDNYYNRYFNDESKWQALRLVHPDYVKTLYGYIDKNDEKWTSLLTNLRRSNDTHITLEVSFPEGSAADNQVFINRCIQYGWVESNDKLTSSD